MKTKSLYLLASLALLPLSSYTNDMQEFTTEQT